MKGSPEWQLGQWGELHVRRYLETKGKFVVPVSCIANGGAPALTRLLERYVLPDHLAFDNGRAEWWEVKTKDRAVLYGITGQWRTGIGERLWQQYRIVEAETGIPGYLAIVQLEPRMLLAAPFERLAACLYAHEGSTDAFGGQEMVWFRVDDFDRLVIRSTGPELPPPPRIEPKTVHPWERGRSIGPQQPRLWHEGEAI